MMFFCWTFVLHKIKFAQFLPLILLNQQVQNHLYHLMVSLSLENGLTLVLITKCSNPKMLSHTANLDFVYALMDMCYYVASIHAKDLWSRIIYVKIIIMERNYIDIVGTMDVEKGHRLEQNGRSHFIVHLTNNLG